MKRFAILGSGSWGTALGALLGESADELVLWGRDAQLAEAINTTRQNAAYLPELPLPASLRATTAWEEVRNAEALLVVVPSLAMRATAQQLAKLDLPPSLPVISCTKGIEKETGARMSQILAENLPGHPIAVLSGPNHAEEIARHQPAAAVLGCADSAMARQLQGALIRPWFRIYTSDDLCGIEWGGAMKNIFAIASGLSSGLKLGDNARAALVTRGLAEMTRLGIAMGGRAETFQGLSGVGDLVVTCYSDHSRNCRVGRALGQGESLEHILQHMKMVAEGVPNTESIYLAARRVGVRTPIIDTMFAILYQGLPPLEALRAFFAREPRPENE